MPLQHFLLRYNLRTQTLEDLTSFGTDAEGATRAYADLEREYRDRADHTDFEIVLIGADSLETIQVTHSRYFNGALTLPTFTAARP
jgi:hypothetical protein